MKAVRFVLLLLILHINSVSAQTVAEVRNSLTSLNQQIHRHSPRFGDGDYDSLYAANDRLMRYLSSVLVDVSGTLTEDFSSVGMWVTTSIDGKLRVWSWDDETGGSMRFCYSIAQYRTPSGIKAELVNDTLDRSGGTPFCDTIYSVESNGKTYYLPLFRGKWSNQDGAQILEGWMIQKERLDRSNYLFDKGEEQRLNEIYLAYNLLTNIDKEHTIHLSDQTILVPVAGDRDEITDWWSEYEFDGEWFVFKRIKKE